MCTLSRDNVRICVLDMWVSFLDIVYVNNNVGGDVDTGHGWFLSVVGVG